MPEKATGEQSRQPMAPTYLPDMYVVTLSWEHISFGGAIPANDEF